MLHNNVLIPSLRQRADIPDPCRSGMRGIGILVSAAGGMFTAKDYRVSASAGGMFTAKD